MKAVLSVWAWTVIVLAVILGFVVVALLSPTILFDRRRRIVGRAFRLSSVVAAKLVPQWRFRVLGEIHRPGPHTVVVGNHRSQSDPFLVSFLPWEMKWMAKASLFRIPCIGWSMRIAGDIPVERGDRTSGRAALDAVAGWVRRGMPVMMFPEGTRSKDRQMLPFKDGAFRVAIETGADILPIAVEGTDTALPKHGWKLGHTDAWVTVGEPIATTGMTLADLPRLKAMARERIEALLVRIAREAEAHGRRPAHVTP